MILRETRLAFMGTPNFAATIFKVLIDAQFPIVAVYTQPPRPTGRGYKVMPSPVHLLATAYAIPVFTPTSLKLPEIQNEWKSLKLDVAMVAAYGLLLPKEFLNAPRMGCINVHASLLPRWRGAAPLQQAILAGDKETGVTLMKMDTSLDTGDILMLKKIPLDSATTTSLLGDRLAHLGAQALLEAIPLYLSGKLDPVPQSEEGATYAQKLKKEEGLLDWQLPANILGRKIRALNPWPGTWFEVGNDRIKILEAEVVPGHFSEPPGTILDDQLTITCGEGALRPLRLQKVGKAPLPTDAFLRGYTFSVKRLSYGSV